MRLETFHKDHQLTLDGPAAARAILEGGRAQVVAAEAQALAARLAAASEQNTVRLSQAERSSLVDVLTQLSNNATNLTGVQTWMARQSIDSDVGRGGPAARSHSASASPNTRRKLADFARV